MGKIKTRNDRVEREPSSAGRRAEKLSGYIDMFGQNKTTTPPKTEYTPTGTQLSADKLKFGYWFVKHRLMIRRIFILTLVGVDAILVIAVLYGFLNLFLLSRATEQRMELELSAPKLSYDTLWQINQPIALVVSGSGAFVNGAGKYDFWAEVENTNANWYAKEVKYHFEAGETVTATKIDYILPASVHYILDLGAETQAAPNAVLVLEDVKWEKVADYEKLRDKILNIEVLEPRFIPSGQSTLSGNTGVSRVEFKAKNSSAYNFWQIDFVVMLIRGNSAVFINKVPVRDFRSGQEKNISFNIYQNLSGTGEVRVLPAVDILNPESFRGFDL
ncbi:TPA: hypothetical protein DF272_05435 [Candidatus Falkowbacteria bacterium]|nr:hypothetical protein [Candidatus Falkowbacteria bacterium]